MEINGKKVTLYPSMTYPDRDVTDVIGNFNAEEHTPRDVVEFASENNMKIHLADYLVYCAEYIRHKYVNAYPSEDYYNHLLDAACDGSLDYFPAPGDFPTIEMLEQVIISPNEK